MPRRHLIEHLDYIALNADVEKHLLHASLLPLPGQSINKIDTIFTFT
jgi:hypothetical protein